MGPYLDVQAVLDQVGQIGLSASTAWRKVQQYGARAQALEAVQRRAANAVPSRRDPIAGTARQGPRQGMALDGGMVRMREEGWKELKLACHFQVGVRWERDPRTRDWDQFGHAQQQRYVAYLGGPEEFGQAAYTLAYQQGWTRAADTLVLGDGAVWIWNQAKEHFFDSLQAVDWYHADEHLAAAGQLLCGEGTPEAEVWRHTHQGTLYEGHAAHIAEELQAAAERERQRDPKRAEELQTAAGYFQENHRRMQYQELREELWPIGSGMIESGAKQYKDRFAGSGMSWSRPGLNALLPFRSAVMSGGSVFDALWQAVRCPTN